MTREMIYLFERMEKVKGENALTEALCIALNKSFAFQREFLSKANVRQKDFARIETQQVDERADQKGNLRPDLWIFLRRGLVLFEIKEEDELTYKQWLDYESVLERRIQDGRKCLFGIVAPWTRVDTKILRASKDKIWWWPEIYRMAGKASASERNSNPVAAFLLEELMVFLEGRGMKPFDGFSKKDMILLQNIHSVSSRMQAFFYEIVNELRRKSKKTVKNGGYEVSVYKNCPELYPGITIELNSKAYSFKGWIGFECASSELPFLLVVSAEDMGQWKGKRSRSTKTKKLEKILNDLGFTWDKDEGYYRKLKSGLHSASQSRDAVKSIAREVQKHLEGIQRELEKV